MDQVESKNINVLSPIKLTMGLLFQGAPKPIAIEPCAGNRAAVLTVFLCLPRGSSGAPPPGQSGMMNEEPKAFSKTCRLKKNDINNTAEEHSKDCYKVLI
jgi:hypothetical protein